MPYTHTYTHITIAREEGNAVHWPVFPEAAVRDDGSHEREEVAQHDEGMVETRGTVVVKVQLVRQKEDQHR